MLTLWMYVWYTQWNNIPIVLTASMSVSKTEGQGSNPCGYACFSFPWEERQCDNIMFVAIAGWRSSVSRVSHKHQVGGSNPSPATIFLLPVIHTFGSLAFLF